MYQILPHPKNEPIPAIVLDNWLTSYRKSRRAGTVPNNLYKAVHTEAIDQLMSRGSQLLLAVNPSYPDQILGWLCHEATSDGRPVVHYCFTKSGVRRQGILRELLKVAGINPRERFYYTFGTPCSKFYPEGRYVPEIARRAIA